MKLIFLDTETTGTEPADRLVQLAYRVVDSENRQNVIAHEGLYKPPVPMKVEAMAVCHITNKMLADKLPFAGSEDAKRLQELFDDPESVLIAHNADFDMGFLVKEGLVLPKKYVCTMKVAHFHDKDAKLDKHTLQFLRYLYELEFEQVINPHDAMSDVIVLEGLFEWYRKVYSVDEMVQISSVPILLKKMMFGKHKGKWFKDIALIDLDYLRWARREMTLDPNLKYTLDYYINARR